MHPILARPSRLLAYVAMWIPLGAALASLLSLQRVFGWLTTAMMAVASVAMFVMM